MCHPVIGSTPTTQGPPRSADLYGHLVPEASERARTALDNAFATAARGA
ncbi:hypothetical protein [Streptosporangium roseum]